MFALWAALAWATCMSIEPECVTRMCGEEPWHVDAAPVVSSRCATAVCYAGGGEPHEKAAEAVVVKWTDMGVLHRVEDGTRIEVLGAFDPPMPRHDETDFAPGACRTFSSRVLPGEYLLNGHSFEVTGDLRDDQRLPWPDDVPFLADGLHVAVPTSEGTADIGVRDPESLATFVPDGFEVVWSSSDTVELRHGDRHLRISKIEGTWRLEWRTGPDGERDREGTVAWTEHPWRHEGTWSEGRPLRLRSWDLAGRLAAEAAFADGVIATFRSWPEWELGGGAFVEGLAEGPWRGTRGETHPPWADALGVPLVGTRWAEEWDGPTRTEATFSAGVLDGTWREWRPTDTVPAVEVVFHAGREEGREVHRDAAGAVFLEGAWQDGKRVGTWVRTPPGASMIERQHWADGEKNGRWHVRVRVRVVDRDRWVVRERGRWRNGEKDGRWVYRYAMYDGPVRESWRDGELVRRN